MKIKDCLETNLAVSHPLLRKEPEKSWILADRAGFIPEMLYKFYIDAEYFSLDKCPRFLNDNQKILFPHLEAAVEIIKSSFEDYYELTSLMNKYDADSYTPFKALKGETFDKNALKLFNRCFQILIINMYAILDSTAETIAIILSWGKLGRGQFSALVADVRDDLKNSSKSSNTKIKYIEDIKNIIKEEIIAEHNNEWYELFKLYRNKQAHFRHFSDFLLHDNKGNFYHFLPRQWPYYFQQDISTTKSAENYINADLKGSPSKLLMEQDIFEYCDGLHKRIFDITNYIFKVLLDAFKMKKDLECNLDAKSLISKYKFKQFR